MGDNSERLSLLAHNSEPVTYRSRYWVLAVVSIFSCLTTWQWDSFGPINESMSAAYGWDAATIALTVNLTTAVFMLSVFPMCWSLERFSMRPSMLLACCLCTVALIIRCFTSEPEIFKILCYISSVLLGVGLTFILIVPPIIANDWFPLKERASAQSVIFAVEQFGLLLSYLEPMVVQSPSSLVSIGEMKNQITRLMYIGAGCSIFVTVVACLYFPSLPPSPPSYVAESVRSSLFEGLASFFKKRDLFIMLLCYTVCTGPAFAWVAVLDFSMLPLGIHQEEAMWVGGLAITSSVFMTLCSGHIADKVQNKKKILILLLLTAAGAFYWFLLLSSEVIPNVKWQVYVASILGISAQCATLPVLYEVAAKLAYPCKDVVVGGVLASADNISASIFLIIYQLDTGVKWVPYALVFSCAAVIPPLLFISIPETREEMEVNSQLQNPSEASYSTFERPVSESQESLRLMA